MPRFSACLASANSCRTTVLLPPIGEMATRADGGFCQAEIQEVGNRGERAIVAFHEASGFFFFGGVEGDGADFLAGGDAIDAESDIFGALEVVVGESDGIDLALAGHIVGSC
jgi:hypothetical protein